MPVYAYITGCRIHTKALSTVLMSFAVFFKPFYTMKSLTMKIPLFSRQKQKTKTISVVWTKRHLRNLAELSGSKRGTSGSGFESTLHVSQHPAQKNTEQMSVK